MGGDGSLVGALFMVLFPLFFACLGAWLLYDVLRVRRTGVRVPGVVGGRRTLVHLRAGEQSLGATSSSAARFSFRTLDGRDVEAVQRIRVTTNLMRTGRRVTVAYDPDRPERAEIIEAWSQVLGALLFLGVGTALLLGALLLGLPTYLG